VPAQVEMEIVVVDTDPTNNGTRAGTEPAAGAMTGPDWAGRLQTASERASNPNTVQYLNRRLELGVDEGQCQYFIRRKNRYCR
jgi:hypothetical protein